MYSEDPRTDEELVASTLQDKAIFGYLIARYEAKMMRYIRRISNVSQEEAEDVLQDIFIKVYSNLNDFDHKLKFSSWIYRIARNEVISNYRKNKVRPQGNLIDVEDDVFGNIASGVDIVKDIDDKELKKSIRKVLEKLDPKYKDVLVLKFLEDKDYKEISDILKKPMGTVATLISRAKKELKKEIFTSPTNNSMRLGVSRFDLKQKQVVPVYENNRYTKDK
jgi:RNA polymerase sigma-70 factor, ECF subfamily